MNTILRINRYLRYVEDVFLVIIVSMMAITLIATTFCRFFGISFRVGEEIAKVLLVSTTYIGSAAAVRKSKHIRMVAISEFAGFKFTRILTLITFTVSGIAFMILTYLCWEFLIFSKESGRTFMSLPLKMWLVWIPVVIGLLLTSLQCFMVVLLNIADWKNINEKNMIWIGSECRYFEGEN